MDEETDSCCWTWAHRTVHLTSLQTAGQASKRAHGRNSPGPQQRPSVPAVLVWTPSPR